ncbi:MAG TPA: GNAT family N-acetyltransferase [Roseiflexaceae bacterium]|nr:GNAT family N-acetyltransferase [Roseiflexaceae bacterium]HMP40721.1 GNAT family N-acetyltransferase [Roseiflexaceae bacterium]
MQIDRYTDVRAFAAHTAPYLLQREPEHHLILGITNELIAAPQLYGETYYLAVASHAGEVCGVVLMTPPHLLISSHFGQPGVAALIVQDLAASSFRFPGVTGPVTESRAIAEAWAARCGGRYERGIAQRIYALTQVIDPVAVGGGLRQATMADRGLLHQWFIGFQRETFGSGDDESALRAVTRWLGASTRALWLWEDGEPVSMAGYSGPTANGVRIAAVYTPPAFRRRGYASACVAGLSRRVIADGRHYCFLFTDLANPTANHIYQQIGYRPICDVDEYDFFPHAP